LNPKPKGIRMVIVTNSKTTATLSAAITSDGMYQIADNYPPGTELDSLLLKSQIGCRT